MKARILLIGSLALNAGFALAFALRPALAPAAIRKLLHFDRTASAVEATPGAGRNRKLAALRAEADSKRLAASQSQLWSELATDDLRALVARLRAAGFPPHIVRAIVTARIDATVTDRVAGLHRQFEETPYWKRASANSFMNPKYLEERQQIFRDRTRMMRELLGDDAFATAGVDITTMQRQQFGNLSKAKIDLVQRVNDDYADMISQVRAATQGIMLPEDRAKLALLEREKRADLAAVLTPEELADYEVRSSPITSRLRPALAIMNATEDEFRLIYQTQQPFADVLFPTGPMVYTPDMRQRREDATNQVATQLKAALGDARYAEFVRAQNYEFQQLTRIAQSENLPATAAVQAFDLRANAAEAATKIGDNRTLTYDQKMAALQDLARTTRTQIASTLGPAGSTYAQSAEWLVAMEKGTIVTIMPDGRGMMFRPIQPPPAAPAAPPPR